MGGRGPAPDENIGPHRPSYYTRSTQSVVVCCDRVLTCFGMHKMTLKNHTKNRWRLVNVNRATDSRHNRQNKVTVAYTKAKRYKNMIKLNEVS